MDGRMSLWEYGAVVHNWNARQPKGEGGIEAYNGPTPTEEEWEDMVKRSAQTVAAAQNKARAH
jgi:hypothetical protein